MHAHNSAKSTSTTTTLARTTKAETDEIRSDHFATPAPDLTTSDYHLCSYIQCHLDGRDLQTRDDIKKALEQFLKDSPQRSGAKASTICLNVGRRPSMPITHTSNDSQLSFENCKALGFCQASDNSDLARQTDFLNPEVIRITRELSDFAEFGKEKELIIPRDLTIMNIGETIKFSCASPESNTVITFSCGERGYIRPHPSQVNCKVKDTNEDLEGVEISWNTKVQTSCEKCHALGTASCSIEPEGFSCICNEGWTGHRCFSAPDMCKLQKWNCGQNGKCVTTIDQAYCACDEGFGGTHCEISKVHMSFNGQNESSFMSAGTASVIVLTASETFLMIGKALLLIHIPRMEPDPQASYQEIRSTFLMCAGYLFLFLHHPGLLLLDMYKCTLAWYGTTTFYSLALTTYALEAINAYEVMIVEQRNVWSHNIDEKKSWYYGFTFRLLFSFAAVGGAVVAVGISAFSQVTTQWTCMGIYSQSSTNLWLPLVLLDLILTLAASTYSYKASFIQWYLPQYEEKMEKNAEKLDLAAWNNVDKCKRDIYFTFIGPWLLCGVWVLQAASSYRTMDTFLNLLTVIIPLIYAACNILQSVVTTPTIYSAAIQLAMRAMPESISPECDPVTMWTKREVLERSKIRKSGGKVEGLQNNAMYPWTPAFEDYLPKSKRARIRRCWMRTYARLRIEEESRTKSELIWGVFVKEIYDHGIYERSKPVLDQLRYLFKCWVVQTYRRDPKKDSDSVQPRRTRVDEELEYLLSNYYKVLNSLSVFRRSSPSHIQKSDYCNSIENYLKTCDTYDPFLMCMINSLDRNGNTQQVPLLRTPLKMLSIQVLDNMQLASEEENTISHPNMRRNAEPNSPTWMLTREEKTTEELRGFSNRVWEMAKQNWDYIQRSKAL
ncbi:hypothetical protein RB195_016035 [Necator americanus]|uniref:EGF-like domain-containing protein n=1 Tax=Necator americanus TaxID=51031 RepID=A0ABR1E949_NECAM